MLLDCLHYLILHLSTCDLLHLAHTCLGMTNGACDKICRLILPFQICLRCGTLEKGEAGRCNHCQDPMIRLDGGVPGFERPRSITTTFESRYGDYRVIWNGQPGPWRPHRWALVVRFWCHVEEVWETQGYRAYVPFIAAIEMALQDDPWSLNPW